MTNGPTGDGDTNEGQSGSGSPTNGGNGDTGNMSSPQQPQLASEELLSSAEMMDAEPCELIEVSEEDIAGARMTDEEAPTGPGEGEGLEAGGQPSADVDRSDDIDTQAGFGYPAPYTTHEVIPDYQTYPYRTVGKLFFKRNGRTFVCSASSIGSNAIWTAGHCLHSGNGSSDGWAEDAVFVPAYKDGNAPFGQWPVKTKYVRTAWYRNGIPDGLCEDMGGAILYEKNGRKLHEVVGWLGFAWNWGREKHWHAMGYPAADPFDGQQMIETAASYAYDGNLNCSPQSVAIGCNQTGGSSGGCWIWRFGKGNYVNGHNSYHLTGRDEEMKSPYFGDAAKSLYDALTG